MPTHFKSPVANRPRPNGRGPVCPFEPQPLGRGWKTNSQRGGALLTVLWMSAGLAAIAFSVSSTVRAESDRASTSADGLRAQYLASGAVERAILWVNWGAAGVGGNQPDGSPRFWRTNLSRLTMSFPSGDAIVDVIPESAKLNVNSAPAEDLYKVVLAVSGDPNRAHRIADGIVARRASSPSSSFPAPPTSLQETEELLSMDGMDSELYYGNYVADEKGRLFARGGLRDCLSPWGSVGSFDVNTASPALMEAMGTPVSEITAIVGRRQMRPFKTIVELQEIAPVTPRLTIGGGIAIYTLRAAARLRRSDGSYSEVVRTAAATIRLLDQRRQQQPPVILRWYSDAWSQSVVPPFPGMPVPAGNVAGQPGFSRPDLTPVLSVLNLRGGP